MMAVSKAGFPFCDSLWPVVIAFWLLAGSHPAAADELERLKAGEVIVDPIENDHGVRGVRASFMVKASREAIWSRLIDYPRFQETFEGIERMRVLKENDKGADVEFWVDAVLTKLHYVLHREYAEPGRRLTWKRISGDLDDIQGSWRILDTDEDSRKLLVYESYVAIGFAVANWAIQQGAMRKARKMGIRFRRHVERDPPSKSND